MGEHLRTDFGKVAGKLELEKWPLSARNSRRCIRRMRFGKKLIRQCMNWRRLCRGDENGAEWSADGDVRQRHEIRERLVSSNHAERRLVYAIADSPRFTQYSA